MQQIIKLTWVQATLTASIKIFDKDELNPISDMRVYCDWFSIWTKHSDADHEFLTLYLDDEPIAKICIDKINTKITYERDTIYEYIVNSHGEARYCNSKYIFK